VQIYRVIISFFYDKMHYNQERAAFAMSAGEALNMVLWDLKVDMSKIHSFKSLVWIPEALEDFGRDALSLPVSGCPDTDLKDLWNARH
jgi:hypothetical protein